MPDPLTSLVYSALIMLVGLLIFWPERGAFWYWRRVRQRSDRVLREDALKHIYHSLAQDRTPSAESLAGALNISVFQAMEIIKSLQSMKLLILDGAEIGLTSEGSNYALRIIRAHRLYERYLAEKTGYDETEWHNIAHEVEHQLTPEEIEHLANQIGNPTHDPHGDPIPMSDGTIVYSDERSPLTNFSLNKPARIVQLKEEPQNVLAQLIAEGLYVGQEVILTESSLQRVHFWADDNEVILAPIMADSIIVIPIKEKEDEEQLPGRPLSTLMPGQEARVVALSPRLRGAERRRLMDLGLLPGTTVAVEMESASGNPVAYRIRGAVIALRKNQAALISVCSRTEKCEENEQATVVA